MLGRTVGLKGALKLHNRSDFPEQFRSGAKFYNKLGEQFVVKSFNRANSSVIFFGFESIELATKLVNTTLYRTFEDTRKYCKLKKGEFFYFDIIGCEVYEDMLRLGKVSDILEIGAGFLFDIKTDENLVSSGLNPHFFIPYLDNFIVEIDIQEKKIIVKNSLEILKNS